ncbi:MAG: DUF3168 domain-containing protein [Caulobacteraceae bacterium]
MSLDAERALQEAILDRLRGEASLQPMLGTPPRVYDEPPPDPIYPYVPDRPRRDAALGRAGRRGGRARLHPDRGLPLRRAEEAKAIVAQARALLHDAELTLQDNLLINLRATYADVFRAADWRSTYGVLRLRAVTEPA